MCGASDRRFGAVAVCELNTDAYAVVIERRLSKRDSLGLAEATGLPVTPAVRVLAPDEAAKAAKLAAVTA